jgi:hypothetical protein
MASVLLMEETGVPGENHWLVTSHWQTWSHNVESSTPHLSGNHGNQTTHEPNQVSSSHEPNQASSSQEPNIGIIPISNRDVGEGQQE